MQQNNLVFKIILPLLIGFIVIFTSSVYSTIFLMKTEISDNSNKNFISVSKIFKSTIQNDTNLMEHLADDIIADDTAIKLFQKKDRESLYKYLENKNKLYTERFDIAYFYIHKINKQNFIRLHNRDRHSDFIDRTTLVNTSINLKMSSGIEFGIYSGLALRVVKPWIVDGKLIGYIELGKEIDKLIPSVRELEHIEMIFSIKKELISKTDSEILKKSTTPIINHLSMKNMYIAASTIDNIDLELQEYIDTGKINPNSYIENNGKQYFINTKEIYDINEKHVGDMYTLLDLTDEYDFMYHLIIKVSFFIFILISILLTYYIIFLYKKEKQLNLAYSKIEKMSIADALTELYNKRYYLKNASLQINKASRNNKYISFILIDVDNFKAYNDTYGHLNGDKALHDVAQIMKKVFKRSLDCCYRVGGEEFLIIAESDSSDNILNMANNLRLAIKNLNIVHSGNESFGVLTVSIGVYIEKVSKRTKKEKLFDNADKALYASKHNGKNKVTLFE